MVQVMEFKNVNELNEYLNGRVMMTRFEIIPVPRMFEHPQTKLMVNSISYVLIQ